VTLVTNYFKCKLGVKYFIAEYNPVIRVKKPGEGKENKVDTRGAVPNRRSVKRFRSPGLDDAASPGEYSCKVCKHFHKVQETESCVQ
jgi:hypothetical protein